jgi:hypothetical protein
MTTIPNQALIDRHRDINTHHDWWDSVYDFFTEDMRTIGIEVDEMYFRGFWSQGDGACFDGAVRDWHKFLPVVDPDYNNPVLIAHATAFFSFSCERSGHYCNARYDADLPLPESSIDMDFAEQYSPYPVDDLRTAAWLAILNRFASSTLEKHFRDVFTCNMQDLYDKLETEYDYLTSDEAVWEAIVANDMHLDEEENNDE